MIVLPLLWQVPKTFHQKFLFPALGHYHVDLDLPVLSVSTCALKHFFASIQFQTLIPRHQWRYFRIIIAYQESIIASFEDIWQSELSQNVDRR